jgi:hypothetical protein
LAIFQFFKKATYKENGRTMNILQRCYHVFSQFD